jgi:chromosome segregation ATPase
MSLITNDPQTMAIAATNEDTLKKVNSWDAMEAICAQSNTKPYIMSQTRTYYSIDVSVAMKELTEVGTLLQVAFAGTKGFKSNASVARVLANYQTLIKNSNVVSRSFVEACLVAIKYHRMVLVVANKPGGLEKALKLYSRCSEVANKMAVESDKLVQMCNSLIETTKQGLVSACDDESVQTTRKVEVKEMIAQLEGKKKQLEVTTKALNEHIEEARKRECEAAKRADEADKRAFITGIVSVSMSGISSGISAVTAVANPLASIASGVTQAGNDSKKNDDSNTNTGLADAIKQLTSMESTKNKRVADNQADVVKLKEELTKAVDDEKKEQLEKSIEEKTSSIKDIEEEFLILSKNMKGLSDNQQNTADTARQAELEAAQLRADLQKQLREQDGEMAKSLALLSSAHEEENYVEQAIVALEVSVKSLGRVLTIFGNTKQFWDGVKKQCESLATIEGTASDWVDVEEKEEFIAEIKGAALKWLSLGNITRIAALSMADVDKNVDKVMTDLPTREESNKLLESITSRMTEGLEESQLSIQE